MQASTEKLSVNSIKVELEVSIGAEVETVWKALTEQIDSLWSRDFFVTGAKKFVMDARLGGYL